VPGAFFRLLSDGPGRPIDHCRSRAPIGLIGARDREVGTPEDGGRVLPGALIESPESRSTAFPCFLPEEELTIRRPRFGEVGARTRTYLERVRQASLSVSATAKEYDHHGASQYHKIYPYRPVLYVILV